MANVFIVVSGVFSLAGRGRQRLVPLWAQVFIARSSDSAPLGVPAPHAGFLLLCVEYFVFSIRRGLACHFTQVCARACSMEGR